ncbi:MAG: MogA/MoaB family molybdenum cofactor biosynthesis protein [Candidatus Manganitrophaceae bacterium]
MGFTVGILSVKERGIIPGEDRVTNEISRMVTEVGAEVVIKELITGEEEKIRDKLIEWSDRVKPDLILTAGGSGLGKQDRTPDATRAAADREVTGIADIMRTEVFQKKTKKAIISRATAGIRNETLIINLPGSAAPARENLEVILGTLEHLIDMVRPKRK